MFVPRLVSLRCDCAIAYRNIIVPQFIPLIPSSDAISLLHLKRYRYCEPSLPHIPTFPIWPLYRKHMFYHKSMYLQQIICLSLYRIIAKSQSLMCKGFVPLFSADAILRSCARCPINLFIQWFILHRIPYRQPISHCLSLKCKAFRHSSPDAISQSLIASFPLISLSLIAVAHIR